MTTNEKGQLRFPALPPGLVRARHRAAGIRDLSRRGHPHRRRRHHRENGRPEAGGPRGIGRGRGRGLAHRSARPRIRDPLRPRRPQDDPDATVEHVRLRSGPLPGISPTSPASGTTTTVSAFGSGTNENQFLIDGTNFTCPCNGVARAEPGVDFIQEVQVQSVGASAEFGNVQGAVINVVTRQGSERFLYDASYYGQTAGLTSQPVVLAIAGAGAADRAATSAPGIATSRRTSAVLSSAIGCGSSRGYQYLRDYDSQPGTDPALPEDLRAGQGLREAHVAAGAGLAAGAERSRRVLGQPRAADARRRRSKRRCAARVGAGDDLRPSDAHVVGQHRVGRARRTVRLLAGRTTPSTGDRTTPSRFDSVTGVTSGAPPAVRRADDHRARPPRRRSATTGPGCWAPITSGRSGGQVERGEHHVADRHSDRREVRRQQRTAVPGDLERSRPTSAACSSPPPRSRATPSRVGDRLTINAGLRFDHSRAISQDLHARRSRRARNRRDRPRAWARCTPGTSCRRAWASPRSSPPTAARCCGRATAGSARAC